MRKIFLILFLILIPTFVYAQEDKGQMKISSPEFANNTAIPAKYTCQGQDINPELNIENIPPETKSLALIVDDPDAPVGTWTHWVVFDIPITNQIKSNTIPGKQGLNTSKITNYQGPCPPSGTHRYFFKLYALDMIFNLQEGSLTKADLEKAMQGHILAQAELIGLYEKTK